MAEPTTPDAPTAEAPADDPQTRAEASETAADEYLTLLKQTRADFENYQKRNARERESERKYAFFPLALELCRRSTTWSGPSRRPSRPETTARWPRA